MRKELTSGGLQIRAHAKLNFYLEILGKRPDGYHEVVTFMVPIGLHDVLEVVEEKSGEIRFWCDDPSLPTGADNLVVQAARMMQQEAGKLLGATLRLFKRIPSQAGLGGGSSDAAATLGGLNRLWGLNFSHEKLSVLAGRLGSDVAFFLEGKPGWCRGRGEQVSPIPGPFPAFSALVVLPYFGLSTARVYNTPQAAFTPLAETRAAASFATNQFALIRESLFNRLQAPACQLEAQLPRLLQGLEKAGATRPLLTGSGSALFALFASDEEALGVAREFLATQGTLVRQVFLTRTGMPESN
ncbi:MAG: 4-(cytidine 5'-diphospho)-2-C-methyl-D-erythritol kinase [Gemmataceae bacterium]|nr:4-(cytidine 5'-diphospho)-2-C-methyl-D-erythritol kinase [Gemmataceae bacterium]